MKKIVLVLMLITVLAVLCSCGQQEKKTNDGFIVIEEKFITEKKLEESFITETVIPEVVTWENVTTSSWD